MDYLSAWLNSVLHIWVVGSSGLSISLAKQCVAYLSVLHIWVVGSSGLSISLAKQCIAYLGGRQ